MGHKTITSLARGVVTSTDKRKADRSRKEGREAGNESVMRRCYMLYKNVIYVYETVNQQN